MALQKFNDGAVFYSEDMDALVFGSNMRFATAAARDAALTGIYAPVNGTNVVIAGEQTHYRRNSAGKWTPMPGTVCFSYASTTAITIASGDTAKTITPWGTNLLGSRNYGNWFNPSNGIFTPDIQGYYEINAACCFFATITTGSRVLSPIYNASGNMYCQTESQWQPSYGTSSNYNYAYATSVIYVASTGGAVYLQIRNTVSSGATVSPSVDYPALFTVKYLGA
jgi:hypothetical protein